MDNSMLLQPVQLSFLTAAAEMVTRPEQYPSVSLAEVSRNPGWFKPGNSGGHKLSPEEKDALEEIRKLAPGVAARMTEMLDSQDVPANVKVRIMEIILERTYGKPENTLKLMNARQSVEAAQARIAAIVSGIPDDEEEKEEGAGPDE